MRSQHQYNGKYKQYEMIGKGRYGTIYRVQSVTNGQQYVAKHIPLDQIEQSVAKKQLQIIKNLRHPYIVEYIDSFTTRTDFIIIMEYCPQKDLDYHIQLMKSRNKHFNQNLIITWLFQLVLGIQFIHSKKILHRDIKPQNIFIDDKMNIKIGDFGISKILNATGEQSKTMTGTPFYLAPEIVNEQLYTTKADIWSLGCLIYQICSLQKPFESKGGILRLMDVIKNGEIKPIPSYYSQDLKKLVNKMMTRDQLSRPNTSQLLKDPLLMDLMIKSSSSMSLKQQYQKNLQQKSSSQLTQSFINKQTNMVHQKLKKFQQQVESKMQRLKKKNINSKQIDEQYQQLKKKMGQIEKAIGKAFTQLKKKAEGKQRVNNENVLKNSSSSMKSSQSILKKSTIQNSSSLTDSSDMTLIQSVVIGQRQADRKSSKILSGSTSYQSVPLISTRNNVFQKKGTQNKTIINPSMIMTESIAFRQQEQSIDDCESLQISSKLMNKKKQNLTNTPPLQQQSFDQTLVSQYQQTHKSSTLAKQTMDKLQFLQKTLSRNPDSILNGSLLSFTLTMSEDEIKRSIRKDKALITNNLHSNNRIKTNTNLDDTINLDLSKRSSSESMELNFNSINKAFGKKKLQSTTKSIKQQQEIKNLHQQNDENDYENYEDDFQQYEEDFDEQDQNQDQQSQNSFQYPQNSTLTPSGVQSIKEKRRLEMNTIKSFYQQTLLEINNQSEYDNQSLSYEQKVKNKFPLAMSEIKEQSGEAGSILSKKNYSNEGNGSVFGI